MDLLNNISINTVFQWERTYPSQASTKNVVPNNTLQLQRLGLSLGKPSLARMLHLKDTATQNLHAM